MFPYQVKSNVRPLAWASFIIVLLLYIIPTMWLKNRTNTQWIAVIKAAAPVQTTAIYSPNPTLSHSIPFPRKHWQTWKAPITNEVIDSSGISQEALTSWRDLNPDFRYELLTDASAETYVKSTFTHRADIVDMFTSLSDTIVRADLFRYLILLADGGVYSDVDTKALKPVAAWIPEQHTTSVNAVLGIEIDEPNDMWIDWADNFTFCQSTLMAKPGHRLFEIVVRNVLSRIAMLAQGQGRSIREMKFSFRDVLRVSGPVAFSDSVFQYLSMATKTEVTRQNLTGLKQGVRIADVLILPVNAFVPGQGHSNSGSPEDATALVQHLGLGSWRNNHDIDK